MKIQKKPEYSPEIATIVPHHTFIGDNGFFVLTFFDGVYLCDNLTERNRQAENEQQQ
jgi:hypothetical protein